MRESGFSAYRKKLMEEILQDSVCDNMEFATVFAVERTPTTAEDGKETEKTLEAICKQI